MMKFGEAVLIEDFVLHSQPVCFCGITLENVNVWF